MARMSRTGKLIARMFLLGMSPDEIREELERHAQLEVQQAIVDYERRLIEIGISPGQASVFRQKLEQELSGAVVVSIRELKSSLEDEIAVLQYQQAKARPDA